MSEAVASTSSGGGGSWSQSQIQSLLECIVCLEPCASPIYTCLDNGHLICGFCHDKLRINAAICPVCKCPSLQPCALAERQSRQNDMLGNCPFSGCSERVLAAGLLPHVKNCEYREVRCTGAGFGNAEGIPCQNLFSLGEFPRHLITVHNTALYKIRRDFTNEFVLEMPFEVGNEEAVELWGLPPVAFYPTICEYDGMYFKINAAAGNFMFYWWITIYAGQKEADRYNYKTQLVWKSTGQKPKNAPSLQTLPVLPYNRYARYDKFCGHYAMTHAATATAYSEKGSDPLNPQSMALSIWISMSKTDSAEGTKRTADTTDATPKKKKNK